MDVWINFKTTKKTNENQNGKWQNAQQSQWGLRDWVGHYERVSTGSRGFLREEKNRRALFLGSAYVCRLSWAEDWFYLVLLMSTVLGWLLVVLKLKIVVSIISLFYLHFSFLWLCCYITLGFSPWRRRRKRSSWCFFTMKNSFWFKWACIFSTLHPLFFLG